MPPDGQILSVLDDFGPWCAWLPCWELIHQSNPARKARHLFLAVVNYLVFSFPSAIQILWCVSTKVESHVVVLLGQYEEPILDWKAFSNRALDIEENLC